MKKLLYFAVIVSSCIVTAQAQQTSTTTSVAPFKTYKTLEGQAEVIAQTFRAEGDDLYNEFEVEVAEAGEYYLSTWMLGAGRQDGSTIAYDIVVNGQPTALTMKPETKDWQNAYARLNESQRLQSPSRRNTLTLVQGRNTIAFKGSAPVVPTVEQIALSKAEGVKAVSETQYQAFKAEVREAANRSTIQRAPALPPQNPNFAYDYDLNFEYKYTSYIRCYFSSPTTVAMGTFNATVPHTVSFFALGDSQNFDYENNSWVKSGTKETGVIFSANVTTPGWYFVILRTKSPSSKGEVSFHIDKGTGGETQFDNLPITCSRLPITHDTDLSSYYATFMVDGNLDWPFITLENDINNPTKVLGYNAIYNCSYSDGFEYHKINYIGRKFSVAPKVVYVCGGSAGSLNDVYHGELYGHLKRSYGSTSDYNTPWETEFISDNKDYENYYNCLSWVGGVISEPWKSDWPNSLLDPYMDSLDLFLSNTDRYGNTLLRYQGATTYTPITDSNGHSIVNLNNSEVVIDLYDDNPKQRRSWAAHAAIRRGSDANPHGLFWESKCNVNGERVFHLRNGEPATTWGRVFAHYKRASVQKSTVEMSMYESLAQGLSVIENPQITQTEKATLTAMKATVSPAMKAQFETQAAALTSVLKQRESGSVMQKASLLEAAPYTAVKDLYAQNKEAVLPLIMDAYTQNKYDNIVLLETMIAENEEYQALAEEILKRNSENQYTPDGAYIVRSAYSNGMLFVKELLKRQSGVMLKKRAQASPEEDIKYSNSDAFEVFVKDGVLSVDFSTEEEAEASVAIYDVNARLITRLANGGVSAGSHRYDWNCTGHQGIYFVQYTLNGNLNVKKVLL